MRCSNDRHAVDVMPDNAKIIDPNSGEEGFMIVRSALEGSQQNWGRPMNTEPDGTPIVGKFALYERMTTMSYTLGRDQDGHVVGVFWMHPRADRDGAEYHEAWLPTVAGHAEPSEPLFTLHDAIAVDIDQDLECVCGQRGAIRRGRWVERVRKLTTV